MNEGLIRIPDLCGEEFENMPRCGNQLYCDVCVKNVTDLRKSSSEEVKKFVTENPGACVAVHERHEATTAGKYRFFNRLEAGMHRVFSKRVAVVCTVALITLSGCFSRKKRHAVGGKFMRPENGKEIPECQQEKTND